MPWRSIFGIVTLQKPTVSSGPVTLKINFYQAVETGMPIWWRCQLEIKLL
ncbi:MAG: hypothetical protein QXR89_04675 [Candidatus Bathyarchaeia archaeon]